MQERRIENGESGKRGNARDGGREGVGEGGGLSRSFVNWISLCDGEPTERRWAFALL